VRLQTLPSVQQPCSNPSKSPEILRKVPMSKYVYLQEFCKLQKLLANYLAAFARRRAWVRIPSAPLLNFLQTTKKLIILVSSKVSCRPRMADARGSSPLGSTLFFHGFAVKREEQEMVPACSRALVQQPSGTTGSCSQSQTSFPPNSLRVHALLRWVRSCEPLRRVRSRASFSCLGAVCLYPMLSLSSQQMKMMNC
jgi:hypothetical protein